MDARELTDKLNGYPDLRARVEGLIRIIENPDGKTTLGDDAEQSVVDELRDLGNDVLSKWASKQSIRASAQIEKGMSNQVRKRGKKKSHGIPPMEK